MWQCSVSHDSKKMPNVSQSVTNTGTKLKVNLGHEKAATIVWVATFWWRGKGVNSSFEIPAIHAETF